MDLWLIAATAATGYITKHLHNAPKGKVNSLESCSEDLNTVKLESPRCLASEFVRLKKPKRENFGDCVNEEDLDLYECGNAYGVEVDSSNEEDLGNNDEIRSDSPCNRAFLRRNQRYTSLIKPFSTEKSVMSQLHREKMSMLSPFPSPCGSVSRPLLVTDGNRVISKNTGGFTSQRVLNCGSPQLRKLESSVVYVKRRAGTEKSASRRSDNGIGFLFFLLFFAGSYDAVSLLCVGISIGIMSSFVANKAKAEIKQTENLVKDLEDELKTKDKDDLQNGEKQCDEKTAEKSESISKIEAELEAELERLEINMTFSNIETRLSDVFELEPDFEVEFAQGELRDDLVGMQRFNETTESNKEPSGNATPESGNCTVSPRELSLRLHKVINSRNEERIKELEMALQESKRKVEQLVMEAEEKKKPVSRFWESHDKVMKHRRDSNRPVSVAHNEKKHNPAEIQPLVMSLAGEALDAFNESYEELMDINDYSEDDELSFKMQDQQEELSLTSKSSPWSHRDDIKASSRTSEDVSFLRLQDLLGLSDKEEEEEEDGEFESEMEKQLIKQIVEKAKQGSSAVFNAQKMLFLMEEIET